MLPIRGWGAVLGVAVALGVAFGAAAPAGAYPAFPLPFPAGTAWEIVGGYNTATHVAEDPYAIDLVRLDAPTAGTPVLAPTDGTLTWIGTDCLTVGDGNGLAILLCHLFPALGLARGDSVSNGQILGELAPSGDAGNGGLAHLHLAVHQTLGDGRLQSTVPFTGSYALEGRALAATDTPNAYASEQFTSSNPGVQTPQGEEAGNASDAGLEPEPATDEEGAAAPVTVELHPGWNLVGWTGATPVSTAVAPIADRIDAVFRYDAATQRFDRFSPAGPEPAKTLATLAFGDGLMVHVIDPAGAEWELPALTQPVPVALHTGFNLVTWTGPAMNVAQAIAPITEYADGVFAFDPVGQRYRVFRPGQPPFLSDLTMLAPAQALWVAVTMPVTWVPPTVAPADETVDGGTSEPTVELPVATPADLPHEGWVLGPGCLNLRPVPTTVGSEPIACLAEGTALALSGEIAQDADGASWYLVAADGLTGWVYATFVHFDEDPFAPGGVNGEATFIHPSLAGQALACGGIYDPADPTIAAATSWPCGTHLRIWRDGRVIEVVVQERGLLGPFHLDLSEAAFRQLGDLAEGRISVWIEVME